MGYAFRRDVMTADNLYRSPARFLVMSLLWAFLYAMRNQVYPGSFASGGAPVSPDFGDVLYFSFTTLTSTGLGDFEPCGAGREPSVRPSRSRKISCSRSSVRT
jgi:hypothetical protein